MFRGCRFIAPIALLALAACTRSGLRIADKDPTPPAMVKVQAPEGLDAAFSRLKAYLETRGRFESDAREPVAQILQPWIADRSLRYYFLDFDRRVRQAVSWKGLWTLKSAGDDATEIKFEIVEMVFLGPPGEATQIPDERNEKGEWFEAEPDSLRAALELKRYWRDNYAAHVMPSVLAEAVAPALEGPPASREMETKGRWKPLARPRAF